jgi:chemotaxis signal transduction protein
MQEPPMSEIPATIGLSRLATRVVALRAGFDRSFAEPAQLEMTSVEDLLAIRAGADVVAIRLSEIAGLYVGKKVTRMPGGDPALLGIAGFRGTIQPVYCIATLIGRPVVAFPRWLVTAAMAPITLAFEGFEHHMRVSAEMLRPRDVHAKDQPYVRDFVSVQQFVRPILHLPSILDGIRTQRPAIMPERINEDV